MIEKLKKNIEPNKKLRIFEIILLCVMLIGSAASFIIGTGKVNADYGSAEYVGTVEMERDRSVEDYDEESTVCDVTYREGKESMIVTYSYEEYVNLEADSITAYEYESTDGTKLFFDHMDPSQEQLQTTYRETAANINMPIFNLGTALIIMFISLAIMVVFAKLFTTYEKIWFLSIMSLAAIVAVAFPEGSANGVNGIIIMLLYLLDTFLNILCELLISKQSRYNFLVSLGVEVVEIAECVVLMYRFSSIVTTLFFWIPIDILSFINWSKHKDEEEEELTAVRKLTGWQEVMVIVGIIVFTFVSGYIISGLNIHTDFLGGNKALETAIIYLDACGSAVAIANGLFIFFRLQEQWIAWYISAIMETIINILSGQYVLLVLKIGYFTNTTYGYIKWNRYIKQHKKEDQKETIF